MFPSVWLLSVQISTHSSTLHHIPMVNVKYFSRTGMKIVTQPIKQLFTGEARTKSDGSSKSSGSGHFLRCSKRDGEYYKEVVTIIERVITITMYIVSTVGKRNKVETLFNSLANLLSGSLWEYKSVISSKTLNLFDNQDGLDCCIHSHYFM